MNDIIKDQLRMCVQFLNIFKKTADELRDSKYTMLNLVDL